MTKTNGQAMGARVKQMRHYHNINQHDLSKRSSISQATISRIETGRVGQLRSGKIAQLAEALGTTTDFLLKGHNAIIHPSDMSQIDQLNWLYMQIAEEDRLVLIRVAQGLAGK